MIGLGLAPLGAFPYGLGVPAAGPPVVDALPLRDDAGVVQTGRLIDASTRQYRLDSFGQVQGMGTVQQLVQLAVSTRLRSSVLNDLGEGLTSIEDIADDFQRRVDMEMRAAVGHLVRDGLITVLEVTTDRVGTSGANIHMRWRDLSTNIAHLTSL